MNPGILFALVALLGWAFGDFFIQKTARAIGSWRALFWVGVFGAVVLLPFVFRDIQAIWDSSRSVMFLLFVATITLIASLFDFAALKEGKLAIVDPLIGLELPLTVQFSAFIIGEQLGQGQTLMIFLIFIGIVLTVTTRLKQLHVHRRLMEKGVALACVAAIGMAAINVLFAVSSRQFSPILSLWFIHLFLAVILGIYSWADGTLDTIIASAKEHPKLIVLQGIFDNGAWLAYSYAVLTIPVGVAVGISESYIAIAAILGITANRERLRRHQIIGLVLVVIGVVTLAAITD